MINFNTAGSNFPTNNTHDSDQSYQKINSDKLSVYNEADQQMTNEFKALSEEHNVHWISCDAFKKLLGDED